jgi:hypothetical protein
MDEQWMCLRPSGAAEDPLGGDTDGFTHNS